MESEVVENKGLPGNGLTDSVVAEEVPLRRSSTNSSGRRAGGKEKISLVGGGKSKGSDEAGFGDEENAHVVKNRLDIWATKCRLTPKRALIYLLVSFLLICLLLLILIIMAVLWPSSPRNPSCKSAACHLFSGSILQRLNASAEPCQDVWQFACGGWLQNSPIPESRAYWDVGLERELEIKGQLRTILNTLPSQVLEDTDGVQRKMKKFYDSCMGTEYIDADKGKPLERIIKNFGGWHVLRDFQKTDWDFPRVLRKLHEEHRASPFFQVRVAPDPRVPSRNIIKIVPAGLSLPDRRYYFELNNKVAEAFILHVKDILQIFGASSLNAQTFAQELFNYEKRIGEVTPPPESLRDPVDTFHRITVRELRSTSSTIFWLDLLKAKFPKGNINDNTEVLVTSRQYLSDISAIISSTDRTTLNNYLMWQLAKKYLPYLSREYSVAYDMFHRQITGRTKPLPRWEFCIDETLIYFRHAADFLLSETGSDRSEKMYKINELFEAIRQSLINRINEATTKFDESVRNLFLDKLRLMLIHVGTPYQNISYISNFYSQLEVQKNEWFTNVRNGIEFLEHVDRQTLSSTNKDASLLQFLSESPNTIRFLPTSNQVVVPETVLQRKVMQLGSSLLPFLLGSVGVELSQAVASAFGIEQGLYGSGGNLMSDKDIKTQTIRDLIDQRRTCLVSFFDNIRLDDRDYLEKTSLDTTIHLAGIQLALNALENHELQDTFLGLPELENLPPNALFFLSYVQSQCSASTLSYHDMEHYSSTTLSHDHRTRGLLRQLIRFTEAFECPSSAELYADFSCGTIL